MSKLITAPGALGAIKRLLLDQVILSPLTDILCLHVYAICWPESIASFGLVLTRYCFTAVSFCTNFHWNCPIDFSNIGRKSTTSDPEASTGVNQ